ncbi:lysophospholipid acyltransferase family protein [Vulgatibacter incomptus]|uniref:Lipid A biosynthesis lauroyl acyltransferase n=1 Tax=Vulgatibacter incomptus TaxID=1391653 RepID=A0A0K1PBX5_9BACT|nr:lysophospholipid acyltransferase family protein [Vulgatibacter incomptus]AKU90619.1 Lipid A biosynthesis lauroyl acyltransferase [Vulgatibacter incomptus]
MTALLVVLGLVVLLVAAILLSQGRVLSWAVARLPQRAALALGAGLGDLIRALGIRREVARANLARAFPEKDEASREAILRGFYRHLGTLIVEFLRAPMLPPEHADRLVEVEGYERFEDAFAEGKGAIIATAHFGNFELLGSFFARKGQPITAITKVLSRNFLNAFWLDQRRRGGLREVPDSGSIRDILGVLRRKEILAVMIDQNMIPRRAIFAPFFGTLAATSPGPAVFAERTGAPVFLVLMHRLPGGRHRVVVEGPIPFDRTGDRDADVLAFTARLNLALEAQVRAEPESWYWVHRRWKTRPLDEAASRADLPFDGAPNGAPNDAAPGAEGATGGAAPEADRSV